MNEQEATDLLLAEYVMINSELNKLEKRKESLYFEIKDNGVGIPKTDQKYLFQRFFRSANVLKQQTEGSGLGLYITKSIIEKAVTIAESTNGVLSIKEISDCLRPLQKRMLKKRFCLDPSRAELKPEKAIWISSLF